HGPHRVAGKEGAGVRTGAAHDVAANRDRAHGPAALDLAAVRVSTAEERAVDVDRANRAVFGTGSVDACAVDVALHGEGAEWAADDAFQATARGLRGRAESPQRAQRQRREARRHPDVVAGIDPAQVALNGHGAEVAAGGVDAADVRQPVAAWRPDDADAQVRPVE